MPTPNRTLEPSPLIERLAVFGPTVIVLVACVISLAGARRAAADRRWVEHAREVLSISGRLRTRMTDAETGQRGYLLTGDSAFLSPYRRAEDDVRAALGRLRDRSHEHPQNLHLVARLDSLAQAKFRELDTTLDLAAGGRREVALGVVRSQRGKRYMDEARLVLDSITTNDSALLTTRQRAESRATTLAAGILIAGAVVALTLGVVTNLLLRHRARERQQALTELETTNLELEAALEDARRSHAIAAEANRAKSELLAKVSHETRQPIHSTTGYIDLLERGLRGPLTEQQRGDLKRMRSAQERLLTVVDDLLDLSRLEAGGLELRIEDVPVADVTTAAAALASPQMREKGIEFVDAAGPCRDGDGEPLTVRADRTRLVGVVANLLGNAVKFTNRGGRVTLECNAQPAAVTLVVRDTGIGIANDLHERVFEPFFQVEGGYTRTAEGVGLGLAISREAARQMGGDLTLESAPGVGSTFTVTVPRAR